MQVIIITGPVGVGKSSVAHDLSIRLEQEQVAHALIDMDWLRWLYPAKSQDPFRLALGYKNLTEVAQNYVTEGAKVVILADVVETQVQQRQYQQVIPKAEIYVVRLSAKVTTLHARLQGRESIASYPWYAQRAVELTEIMESHEIGDYVIETDEKLSADIASEIYEILGNRGAFSI